jgi:7-cyano-7-deazaguanine synthase
MTQTAFVLLSGGIDSTTCLRLAKQSYPRVIAFIADYGQRHEREIEAALKVCKKDRVHAEMLMVRGIIPPSALTKRGSDADIPDTTYAEIKGKSPAYVPFRNGLLVSAAASRAVGFIELEAKAKDTLDNNNALYFGAHAEDARSWAYADCTPEFIGAMANAVYIGTYGMLRLATPLEWMTKADIIRTGTKLGIDYSETWSCYRGGRLHCGACPSCYARRAAFSAAGVPDPTAYEDDNDEGE